MKSPADRTVRRSVALPQSLIDALKTSSPPELRSNFNRLIITALREFVRSRERMEFDRAMARMAADPAAKAEITGIQQEFQPADADGLPSLESW
ncbi:MAG: hypothetical protein HY820_16345 [Acidobacteria bacterium]|nr:hypothetical protein [Acidobacteriota bacterium]